MYLHGQSFLSAIYSAAYAPHQRMSSAGVYQSAALCLPGIAAAQQGQWVSFLFVPAAVAYRLPLSVYWYIAGGMFLFLPMVIFGKGKWSESWKLIFYKDEMDYSYYVPQKKPAGFSHRLTTIIFGKVLLLHYHHRQYRFLFICTCYF